MSDHEREFQEISHKANTNIRWYYMCFPGASGIDCLVNGHFLSCKDKEGLMVGDGKLCQILVHIHYLIYRGPVSWACIFMRWHVFTVWFQHSYKLSTYVIRELSSVAHWASSFPSDVRSEAFLQPFHDPGCQNSLICRVRAQSMPVQASAGLILDICFQPW